MRKESSSASATAAGTADELAMNWLTGVRRITKTLGIFFSRSARCFSTVRCCCSLCSARAKLKPHNSSYSHIRRSLSIVAAHAQAKQHTQLFPTNSLLSTPPPRSSLPSLPSHGVRQHGRALLTRLLSTARLSALHMHPLHASILPVASHARKSRVPFPRLGCCGCFGTASTAARAAEQVQMPHCWMQGARTAADLVS